MAISSATNPLQAFRRVLWIGLALLLLSAHYIICGAGRVGRSAARELARKPVPFVIIEKDQIKAEELPPEWLMMFGDATQESTLIAARIDRAAGLVAATTTDASNIFIV